MIDYTHVVVPIHLEMRHLGSRLPMLEHHQKIEIIRQIFDCFDSPREQIPEKIKNFLRPDLASLIEIQAERYGFMKSSSQEHKVELLNIVQETMFEIGMSIFLACNDLGLFTLEFGEKRFNFPFIVENITDTHCLLFIDNGKIQDQYNHGF